jgi:hypothetical protein
VSFPHPHQLRSLPPNAPTEDELVYPQSQGPDSKVQPHPSYGWWVLGTYAFMVVLGAWNAPWFILVSGPVIVTAGVLAVARTGGRTGPVIGVVGGGLVVLLFLINLIFTLADGGHFQLTAWGQAAAAAGVLSASIFGLLDMNKRSHKRPNASCSPPSTRRP